MFLTVPNKSGLVGMSGSMEFGSSERASVKSTVTTTPRAPDTDIIRKVNIAYIRFCVWKGMGNGNGDGNEEWNGE